MPSGSEPFIESWFHQFAQWLDTPSGAGEFLLEALDDASNELLATAVAAAHLRRFGREHFGGRVEREHVFWARTEWGKWDLTYGLASDRFDSWDVAWRQGRTGALGVIEAKVHYVHHEPSKTRAMLLSLERQLKERAEWYENKAKSSHGRNFGFHGLVFAVRESDSTPDGWLRPGLEKARSLVRPVVRRPSMRLTAEMRRELWPLENRREVRGIDLVLLAYDPTGRSR